MPAGSLVGGGRQGCDLAARAAVGMQLGSVDDGSLARGPGRGSPAFRSSGIAAGPARLPAGPLVRWRQGCGLGGDGGGRDMAWQCG